MKFGLTQTFECSYLPDHEEQLLVFVPQEVDVHSNQYDVLLRSGFRRSGEQVYRPHCPACQKCQSLRIVVNEFTPSKSQKRIRNKNRDVVVKVSQQHKPQYYALYERYINHRHADGTMYPATISQYESFIFHNTIQSLFLECYVDEALVAVAVMDVLEHGLSALYTFFDPDMDARSLGTFAVLQQIEQTRRMHKQHLYLGYQIDACQKMNYKANFDPHERFIDNNWQRIAKISKKTP